MLIAQITDLHMRTPGDKAYGIIDPAAFLGPAVRALNALTPRPDCVLITGDLTDLGRPHEYQALRDQLQALEIPYFLPPGNHDDRAQLRAAFPDHGYLQGQGPFIQYAVETYPLRLLALDTVVPMKSHGELCDERLGWLAARLAEQPDRPTLVLMHHPPFQTGIEHMDDIGLLAGGPELERIVARYPRVERVLCGHLHRTIFRRFGGTIASTCPGTAHQLALELGPRPTLQYIMEPPGYQLHWWHDGALVTHHAVIGEYPGPYPFA
ncbi:phosphodiesterase [Achromobacter dolens]|uniref:phosphodiesterase n=1 Tax=Achromobacter dolens TaxID=1287738 RepID=UPI003B992412